MFFLILPYCENDYGGCAKGSQNNPQLVVWQITGTDAL